MLDTHIMLRGVWLLITTAVARGHRTLEPQCQAWIEGVHHRLHRLAERVSVPCYGSLVGPSAGVSAAPITLIQAAPGLSFTVIASVDAALDGPTSSAARFEPAKGEAITLPNTLNLTVTT